jgi:hypothetical protein
MLLEHVDHNYLCNPSLDGFQDAPASAHPA